MCICAHIQRHAYVCMLCVWDGVMQNLNEYIWLSIAIYFNLHEEDAVIQERDTLYLNINESLIY